MPKFKPVVRPKAGGPRKAAKQFATGDCVRFNKETRAQLSATEHGPGVVVDNRPLDDEGVWVQVHWDNDSWSTEKPEWLEILSG